MDIKDILLILDADGDNAAPLAQAAALAAEHQAQVHGLCFFMPPAPTIAESFALGPAAPATIFEREARELETLLAPIRRAFEAAFAGAALPPVWEPRSYLDDGAAIARSRVADLTIAGGAGGGEPLRLTETLIIHGGAPVLVVPQGAPPVARFGHAVVGWNGSREAKRALTDALPLLRRAERTQIVVVNLPATAPDTPDLADLIGHLQRHGVDATLWRIEAPRERADEALRRHCHEAGADLLVVGAYSHSHQGEQVFGGVTRRLIAQPDIATLFSH